MNITSKFSFAAGICGILIIFMVGTASAAPPDASYGNGLFARINTDRGDIVVQLEFQKTPLTVCNFVALAEGKMNNNVGKRFYDGLNFHRVEADFITGGDPLGTGYGGPGYSFPDEIVPSLKHDGPGILSMLNAGPGSNGTGTNGSQFLITNKASPWLDGKHTVFGKVVEGQDVVDAIKKGDKIRSVIIIRNGPLANQFKADQVAFDTLLKDTFAAIAARVKAQREADITLINTKYPNAVQTPSGVKYIIQKKGTGNKPATGKTVQVKYVGSFLSGTVFDSSDIHGGKPLEFQAGVGAMIKGWDEMAMDMQVGEKRTVIIPPELAYGERGMGNGTIPPNTFLVFEMELVGVK